MPQCFIRTHKGFLVNRNHVKEYGAKAVVLDNGESVVISTRRQSEAKRLLEEEAD